MRNSIFIAVLFIGVYLAVPVVASAHQPRIPSSTKVTVQTPQVSQAFYAQLAGEPYTYTITSGSSFDLYVNVLVPDIEDQKRDVSAIITKVGETQPIAILNASNWVWQKFYEPFGRDSYLKGPEFEARVDAGMYEIKVWSPRNDSKYALAIGKEERFGLEQGLSAIQLIPRIKRDFFNESPAGFIFSAYGAAYVFVLFIFSFIAGFLYRGILRYVAAGTTRGLEQNIGRPDRLVRALLGIVLFVWAITTSWSPILFFFSGFCFFQAIFSWCGFYAALGRTTCPA